MNFDFDVIVIGGGPGGIEAAVESGKKNLRTAIVTETQIGGRAIWSSLLPSKLWVQKAELFGELKEEKGIFDKLDYSWSLEKLKNEIKETSESTSKNYEDFLKKLGVEVLSGKGIIKNKNQVEVTKDEQPETYSAENIVVSSGSGPFFFPGVKPNGDRIIAPRFASKIEEFPKSLIMIGGGVTGSEYANVYRAMGVDVKLITDMPALLPAMDEDIQNSLKDHFEDIGIELIFNAPAKSVEQNGKSVKVTLKDGSVHEADYAFLALGRKPDLSFMGDKTDLLEKDKKGNIKVNEFTQTSINNVYLIGDANGDPMTANKARVQAKIAISHISGNKEFKYEQAKIVQPVYTSPPLANVGLTEKQAVKQGIKYQIYKTDLNNLIKNVLHQNTHGFVKVLLNEDDVIIGGSGFGYESQEVISTLALNIGRKWEESMLSKTSYAYPSWMEAFLEF